MPAQTLAKGREHGTWVFQAQQLEAATGVCHEAAASAMVRADSASVVFVFMLRAASGAARAVGSSCV